jgi:putative phosphoesterase
LLVGVISDTHGLLRPEAMAALTGAEHILHAGDVGDAAILDALRKLAPVTAIRGNVDATGLCADLPVTEIVELDGCLIYMVHALEDLDLSPAAAGLRMVVHGHSHTPSVEERKGVLYLNPGSAGPRRFSLPVTVARVRIEDGSPIAEIVELKV